MTTIKLHQTTSATAKPIVGGGYLLPINTASGGECLTIRARYEALGMAEELIDLAHFAKTAILIEYDL